MEYSCDAGSLRIDFAGGWIWIPNGIGDGTYNLEVLTERDIQKERAYNFVLCFAVLTTATVSGYDYFNDPLITLDPGHYGAYNRDGDMLLVRWDGRTA